MYEKWPGDKGVEQFAVDILGGTIRVIYEVGFCDSDEMLDEVDLY